MRAFKIILTVKGPEYSLLEDDVRCMSKIVLKQSQRFVEAVLSHPLRISVNFKEVKRGTKSER